MIVTVYAPGSLLFANQGFSVCLNGITYNAPARTFLAEALQNVMYMLPAGDYRIPASIMMPVSRKRKPKLKAENTFT